MASFGRAREGLASAVNAAFVHGLISTETHAYRLGLLFSEGLIDQERIVGDLSFRPANRLAAGRDAWSAIVGGIRALVARREATAAPPPLLSLDRIACDQLLFGRHAKCDIVLDDRTVSRRHALLVHRDGAWMIRDLGSTNGTAVNGRRVGRALLRAGDVLTLGRQPIQID